MRVHVRGPALVNWLVEVVMAVSAFHERSSGLPARRPLGRIFLGCLAFLLIGCAGEGDVGKESGNGESFTTVRALPQRHVDKADLLFMIDNSVSMREKQRLLAEAMPVLLRRLTDPDCVDEMGRATGRTSSLGCQGQGVPEFPPLSDIHIGIVTSSLGSHGGELCVDDPNSEPTNQFNDAAQLLPTARSGLYSYKDRGFLVWDPRTPRPPSDPHPDISSHESDPDEFVRDLVQQVEAVDEQGCGYEGSLEAWYRFLVDPEPIKEVAVIDNRTVRGPTNQIVLDQRAAFLRPDSVLAIVMLTDENDCSIIDENGEQGWLVGRRSAMPRGSDACARPEDPNVYRCCIPCVYLSTGQVVQGCDYSNDIACSQGDWLTETEDSPNLRCYRQLARFGVDLLYPWQRYIDALVKPRITLRGPNDSGATEVVNPIYAPGTGMPAREADLVILAGIVGVPWQDLATEDSLNGRSLTYLTASEMDAPPFGPSRWDVVLGDPDVGRLPSDPFMIESIDPRTIGVGHPVPGVGASITPTGPSGANNPVNGHEQSILNRDDLQYACTFPLERPLPCTPENEASCDCNASEAAYQRPICEYSGEGDGAQTHAKAYPSLRQLQVLKGLGDNAVVASICPKNTTAMGVAAQDPDYGYNPAIAALVRRLGRTLGERCLPVPLSFEGERVPCRVVEVASECSCDAPGYSPLSSNALREGDVPFTVDFAWRSTSIYAARPSVSSVMPSAAS